VIAASVIELLKANLRLDSPLPFLLALAAGVAWLYLRPSSRGPRRLLLAALIVFWLVATPLGAGALARLVGHGFSSLSTAGAARGADTIVLLGGGEDAFAVGPFDVTLPSSPSALRALEAARVYHLLGGATVIASGGRVFRQLQPVPEAKVLKRLLVESGVPADRILEEAESTTTREQALDVAAMLTARGVSRFVLVTSATHIRRASAAFRVLGFDPVPSAAPVRSTKAPPSPWLLPSGEWLHVSDMAAYDAVALMYYRWKGWA
jgi:uncharacterized SAM-binding protein YcdF (DUF218 family)